MSAVRMLFYILSIDIINTIHQDHNQPELRITTEERKQFAYVIDEVDVGLALTVHFRREWI